MKFHLNVLIAVAVVPGLTGVLQGSRDTATVSSVCGLVTRQEAAAALGAAVPVGTEKRMDVALGSSAIKMEVCFYGAEVHIARYDLGSSAAALFGQYRHSLASSDGYKTVSGVGDEAFAAKGQLYVRKGQFGVNVDVGQARGGGEKELASEKGLATLAVGRL